MPGRYDPQRRPAGQHAPAAAPSGGGRPAGASGPSRPQPSGRPRPQFDPNNGDSARYLKFLAAQQERLKKIRELQRLAAEAEGQKRKAAAAKRLADARDKAATERNKHQDLLKKAETQGWKQAAREHLQQVNRQKQADKVRQNPEPGPHGAELGRAGAPGTRTTDEFGAMGTIGGKNSGFVAKAGDLADSDVTSPEDVRFLIKRPDGKIIAKKPSVAELVRWFNPQKGEARSSGSEALGPDGQPIIPGQNDNVLDPGRHVAKAQLVGVVGAKGPLLVDKNKNTVTTVHEIDRPYQRRGFAPGTKTVYDSKGNLIKSTKIGTAYDTAPDAEKVTKYARPGEYMTARQYRDYVADLSKSNPKAFADLQHKLAMGGYMANGSWDDSAKGNTYVPGVMDRQTLRAINGFTYDLSQLGAPFGKDAADWLNDAAGEVSAFEAATATGGGGGGGGGGANPYAVTSPETLKLVAEQTARAVLGRLPTAEEEAAAISTVQDQEKSSGGLTSGAIPTVNPEDTMTEFFRKKAPADSGAHNIAQAFDAFASILGPGGGAGQGNTNIDLGNTKITA